MICVTQGIGTNSVHAGTHHKQMRVVTGKTGTGISLILDLENGIYSLGLGFSHWEWDEQL